MICHVAVVAGPTALNHDRTYGVAGDSAFAILAFFAYKNCYAEPLRELETGCTVCRYEQFEISPETIEQELGPTVC